MRKHFGLMNEINDMSIAIKIHHFDLSKEENQEAVEKAKSHIMKPTWENIVSLFDRAFKALDEQRENPIKY